MSLRLHTTTDLASLVVGEPFQVADGKPMVTVDTPDGESWIAATGTEGVAYLWELAAKLTLAGDRLDAFITAAGGAA